MANFNYAKTIVVGNLGKDPDIGYTQSQKAVINLVIGVTGSYKDKTTDEWKSTTEWYRVVMYNLTEKQTKYFQNNFRKGDIVHAEGEMRTRKWRSSGDPVDHYTTELIANSLNLVVSKAGKAANAEPVSASRPATSYTLEDPFAGMESPQQ